MKKIVIVCLHLGHGGIEKYVSSLANILSSDYNVEIISVYKTKKTPAYFIDNKVKIFYLFSFGPYDNSARQLLNSKKYLLLLKEIFKRIYILFQKKHRIKKAIKNVNCDIIISTRIEHNRLINKYLRKGIIKIASEHNSCNDSDKYNNKVIKSLKGFDYYIAISKELYNYYNKRIGNTKCIYIPNVIDKSSCIISELNNNNIITVGRLATEKGFYDLIEIINLVKKEIPDVHLTICGDGSEKNRIEEQIDKYALKNNVSLLGFIGQTELEKKYLKSSLYVMTSFTESFGLVLIEAMNYGLPCIAFDSATGAKELLKNTGILVKNRDKQEMTNKIVELLNNKKELKKYSDKSKKKVKEYLSEKVKNQWLKLLK